MSFADIAGVPRSRRKPAYENGGSVIARLMAKTHSAERRIPPVRPLDPKDPSTYMRASSVGFVCSRYEALRIAHKATILDSEKVSDRFAMSVGTAYHRMMQDDVMPAVLSERMVGWWRGLNANTIEYASDGLPMLVPRPDDGKHWVYEEVFAFDSRYGIGGHPDAIVDWRGSGLPDVPDDFEVEEIKTRGGPTDRMAEWRFDDVDPDKGGAPLPFHVLQIQTYMWLLNLKHGRLIYVKPGSNQSANAIVEWRIPRDEAVIDKIKANLEAFWADMDIVRTTGFVTPHGLCNDFSDNRARECPMRFECFNRKARGKRADVEFG